MSIGAKERWQARAIEQLSTASNLIFILCLGALAFTTDKILENKMQITDRNFWLFAIYASLFIISLIFGFLLVINRLLDFRESAEIARISEEEPQNAQLGNKREKNKKRGKYTWVYFQIQLLTFAVGLGWYFFLLFLNVYKHAYPAPS